jgi:hypothetical protein
MQGIGRAQAGAPAPQTGIGVAKVISFQIQPQQAGGEWTSGVSSASNTQVSR